MDKKLILELINHNVYYVKTDIINYYAPVAVKEKKDLMSSKILLALQKN